MKRLIKALIDNDMSLTIRPRKRNGKPFGVELTFSKETKSGKHESSRRMVRKRLDNIDDADLTKAINGSFAACLRTTAFHNREGN